MPHQHLLHPLPTSFAFLSPQPMPPRERYFCGFSNAVSKPARRRPAYAPPRSPAAACKYFAVTNGRDGFRGVVSTWAECAARLAPGAAYRTFNTREDANDYLRARHGAQSPHVAGAAQAKGGKRKFYAVRKGKGGYRGVLAHWDACRPLVNGVKGAQHKCFKTYEEAAEYAGVSPLSERKPESELEETARDCEENEHATGATFVQGASGEVDAEPSSTGPASVGEGSEIATASGVDVINLEAEENVVAPAKRSFTGEGAGENNPEVIDVDADDEGSQAVVHVAGPAERTTKKRRLVVHTDGACSNNGKTNSKAGYGVFFGEGNPYNVSSRLDGPATNQRAEMMAVLVAMRSVLAHDLIVEGGMLEIHTDSQYLKNGVESWVDGWKRRKWKTSSGSNVKNKDLWVQLDDAKTELRQHRILFQLVWVKGHAGNPGNEAADRLAVAGISGELLF